MGEVVFSKRRLSMRSSNSRASGVYKNAINVCPATHRSFIVVPVAGIRPALGRPVGRWTQPLQPLVCGAHAKVPPAQGLFNPADERDACGVGFVGELTKEPTRACVTDALGMLVRMTHRGACGCEANTGICLP